MKTLGIIAEYNPFHNGHRYQIEEAKKLTGADYAVIIMSGDYVQRGTPASADKYLRTQMALNGGADIIFELPVIYSTASAEYFAHGAASLLNALSCIDYLCFGSECGNINILSYIAEILSAEPAIYQEHLKTHLKKGTSFPAAREQALLQYCSSNTKTICTIDEIKKTISMPNNILGIEYLKALHKTHSSLQPITIKRKGSGYHDSSITTHSLNSASAVRGYLEDAYKQHHISKEHMAEILSSSLQPDNLALLYDHFNLKLPVTADDYSLLLRYALRSSSKEQITRTADFTEDIFSKIQKNMDMPLSFTELSLHLKSKQYTFTRIQRMLLHLLLNISKDDMSSPSPAGYIRLLGFNRKASQLLRYMQDHAEINIITKPADAKNILSHHDYKMYEKDIKASRLYADVCADKFKSDRHQAGFIDEYRRNVIIS